MSKDKVMHPGTPPKGRGIAPQVKSSIVEGPTSSEKNMTAYNREGKKK